MKKGKVKMAVILCFMLLLSVLPAGCTKKQEVTAGPALPTAEETKSSGDNPEDGQQTGGYVEEEVEMAPVSRESGEDILNIFIDREQNWRVYTAAIDYSDNMKLKEVSLYIRPYKEGDWKKEPVDWIKKAVNSNSPGKNFQTELLTAIEGEDGNDYAIVLYRHGKKMDMDGYTVFSPDDPDKDRMIACRKDNKTGKVSSVRLKADSNAMLKTAAVTEEGEIVLGFNWEPVRIYSGTTGALVATPDFKAASLMENFSAGTDISGNQLAGWGQEGLSLYDAKQKKALKTISYDFPKATDIRFSIGEAGGFLIGDRNGLHHVSGNGTLWETIIEGFQTAFGLGEGRLDSIYLLGEQEDEFAAVLANVSSDTGYKLVRYVFDKNKPAVNQTLTVYSLHYDGSLQESINRYQIKYRDIKVDYIVGKEEDGTPDGDAVRAFNVELLNGKGPDIMVLDGLPAESYIEKGILADIGGIVGPMAESGKLLKNIVSPYQKEDGKMYRVPMRFRLPWVTGKKEALQCLGSAEKTAEYIKNGDGTAFTLQMSYEALSSMFLSFEYNSLFGEGEPDSGRIKRFLESLKTVAENTGAAERLDNRKYGEAVMRDRRNGAGYTVDFAGYNLGELLLNGDIEAAALPCGNTANAGIGLSLRNNRKNMGLNAVNQSFVPLQFMGIHKESREYERAAEFLRFILEEEPEDFMKATKTGPGYADTLFYHFGAIPIYSKMVKEQLKEAASSGYTLAQVNGKEYKLQAEQKDYELLLEEIEALAQPLEVDQELFDMAVNGAVSYLSGRETAEQAAGDICNEVKLYQAERE